MTRSSAAVARGTDTSSRGLDLSVSIGSLKLRNPVMPASGCFGPELSALADLGCVGASVTKTVFLDVRAGNPAHRLYENGAGVFNSVGIPSLGPVGYLREIHPQYRRLPLPVITSVGAHHPRGYAEVIQQLDECADTYELNVSCPNLDNHGVEIGSDPIAIEESVSRARKSTRLPLIVKLSPMVASIGDCARAAEAAGADAVCVSNSLPSMPVDPKTLRPALGNSVGGLTGPSIRPIVLRLVWLTATAVSIPVIACGGIGTATDALEYFSVGATAVQVGTASFADPSALSTVATDLAQLVAAHGAQNLAQAVSAIQGEER